MRTKKVILCEFCSNDQIAVNVIHAGACGTHDAAINALMEPGAVERLHRRSPTAPRKKIERRLHKKCGRMIAPQGWTKHVASCKGKRT